MCGIFPCTIMAQADLDEREMEERDARG